jgi:hypothetical protein
VRQARREPLHRSHHHRRRPGAPGHRPASRLFGAQQAGATEQLRDVTAEGLAEMYFRDAGRRVPGLLMEFTDVEQVAFGL